MKKLKEYTVAFFAVVTLLALISDWYADEYLDPRSSVPVRIKAFPWEN